MPRTNDRSRSQVNKKKTARFYHSLTLFTAALICIFVLLLRNLTIPLQVPSTIKESDNSAIVAQKIVKVFVSYVYCEEGTRNDSLQNLEFFLRHGASTPNYPSLMEIDYGLTVNGKCTKPQCNHPELYTLPNNQGVKPRIQKLQRENSGFDFGAHDAMLRHLDEQTGNDITHDYDAFVFLNDGVTGPIMPSYMPKDWHWVSAFLDRIRGDVGLVGTSIVCLPKTDFGGWGPKVEGFSFALSSHALKIVRTKGTSFQQHTDKTAAVVKGEYNLTTVLLHYGVRIDSLLKAYQGVDWRDKNEWGCNNHKHPSRSGSYFGTSLNPMEVLFHKAHWAGKEGVNIKELNLYTKMADDALKRNALQSQ